MRRAWVAIIAGIALWAGRATAEGPGLGTPLAAAGIPDWARVVMPDGDGLPAGSGTARTGAVVYQRHCASCHGETGVEGPIQPLVGPTKVYAKPAGAHWPHAPSLFGYVQRAMPFDAPKSLSNDEVYAVTAWILVRNGIIAEDAVVDAASLPKVQMPNRQNFLDLWELQQERPY